MLPDQSPHAKPNRCRGRGPGVRVLLSESPAPRIMDSKVGYGMATGGRMQTPPHIIEIDRVSAKGIGSLDAIEDHLAHIQRRAQP